MAENSFPIADGGNIAEDTYERLMAQTHGVGRVILANGVGEPGNGSTSLVYADSTGRQVKIKANEAYNIRGFRWESGTEVLIKAIAANTSGKTRIDRVVLRLDRSDYTIRVAILPGTAADAPAPPTVTRTYGATGVYEVAIAKVTVTSSTTSGLPSITAANVVDETLYEAPTGLVSPGALPSLTAGQFFTQTSTDRLWVGNSNSSILLGERGPFTKLAVAGGWTLDYIYAQRVNGWTYFQCGVALNVADRPAGTDMTVCTLPAQFRTNGHDIFIPCLMSPGQIGFGYLDGPTGVLSVTAYPQTFPKGGLLRIGPISWPSNGG